MREFKTTKDKQHHNESHEHLDSRLQYTVKHMNLNHNKIEREREIISVLTVQLPTIHTQPFESTVYSQ